MIMKLKGRLLKIKKRTFIEDSRTHQLLNFKKNKTGIIIGVEIIDYREADSDAKLEIFIDGKIYHKYLMFFEEFKIENYKEILKLL